MRLPATFACLSVCWQDYSKTCAWISMTFCVSTDVGTWTNWSTFEPDPDHSPDAVTGLLSPIAYALQRLILLRRENPYWAHIAAATRHVVLSRMHYNAEFHYVRKIPRTAIGCPSKQRCMVLTSRNTIVAGKCALLSALLVCIFW